MDISQNIVTQELQKLVNIVFSLPEACSVKIRDIVIDKMDNKESMQRLIVNAVEQGYHDVLSDTDLTIVVKISPYDTVTPDMYVKMLGRYGITKDRYLGLSYIKEHRMYRIIMKNGMRYDLGFEFVQDEKADRIHLYEDSLECIEEDNGIEWLLKNADGFWFVQIQALAKLYRDDYLIADHLANLNINETLVLQMMLRDKKYKTNFHRYGYGEELQYLQNQEHKCPYVRKDGIFNMIAEKLYRASAAYDQLAKQMNSQYTERREYFSEIWMCYDREIGEPNSI